MCGIAGLVGPQPTAGIDHITAAMLGAIEHRGPDASGAFVDSVGSAALGSRRLAIIDLSPAGNQPIFSPDRRFVLVFNGEIYNYLELRRTLLNSGCRLQSDSDTEVLVALFAREGIECLSKLNGMFAFALWDDRERTLWLARDRLGKKPLLYAHSGGELVFASEIQALLMRPGLSHEVRPE